MGIDVEDRVFSYINRMTYPALIGSARVDLIQEFVCFVNCLAKIKYFSWTERGDLIQIARNISNLYHVYDLIDFKRVSEDPLRRC